MSLLLHKPNTDIQLMKELIESKKVVPVIDRCYPLNEVTEAFKYYAEGHAKGKVIITVNDNK